MSDVAVVGAGRMGTPIISHLVKAGHRVTVFDVDVDREGEIEKLGATWVGRLGPLAAGAEFTLVCVGFDREVVEVITQEGGLLESARPQSVIAVLSTVSPETVQELATLGDDKDVAIVDATVCRGSWYADEGTLLTFIGGSKSVFSRLYQIADAFSSDIVHTGAVGSAQVCKAVNNLILWACLIADHEGFALADRYGVDIDILRQALMISSANNGALKEWPRQTMAWAEDDMEIVQKMAQQVGIGLPQVGLNRELCRSLLPRRYDLTRYGI